MNRRHFLATGALALAATGALPAAPTSSHRRAVVQLGVASYSFWHFQGPKVSIETVIERAAEIGFAGVDILHRQMDLPERDPLTSEHRSHLRNLKRHALRNGVSLICLSTHQGFVNPDPAVVAENITHTRKCIEICYELGIPAMRINTGRWGTTGSFDELMRNRGVEPVLPGHTEDEGFKWCQDAIAACLPKAEECGVMLALENHWGLARTAEGLMRIVNNIKSPWLGVLMDTGNFLAAPYKTADYEQLRTIAPETVYVQAKTYPGGGEWYTLDIDYRRVADLLADVNYRGWVTLEMEGKEAPETAIPKSLKMLRKAFAP